MKLKVAKIQNPKKGYLGGKGLTLAMKLTEAVRHEKWRLWAVLRVPKGWFEVREWWMRWCLGCIPWWLQRRGY